MNPVQPQALQRTTQWLARHTAFPISRLESRAELLLLLAAAAEADEPQHAGNSGFGDQRRVGAKDAALRAHQLRRSLVHFKCDNSAKV